MANMGLAIDDDSLLRSSGEQCKANLKSGSLRRCLHSFVTMNVTLCD